MLGRMEMTVPYVPWLMFHFYRASICEGGLGSRNSVRLSVRLSHVWIVTKLNGTGTGSGA